MPVALSNCNLASVCQYGGQAKGDGTQGCSCWADPDCSSTEKCPLGLGGEPKADGSQACNCVTYTPMAEVNTSLSQSFASGTRGLRYVKISASWTGGLPPYTYNFVVSGPGTRRWSLNGSTENTSKSGSTSCKRSAHNCSASCQKNLCTNKNTPCGSGNSCSATFKVTDATGSVLILSSKSISGSD